MRLDLNTPVTIEGFSAVARGFLDWWREQLLGLLPLRARSALSGALQHKRVSLEGNVLHLKSSRPGAPELTFALGEPGAVRAQISREATPWLKRRVDVELEPSEVLVRQISFPRAAASRLASAIKLQLDRLSPFHGEDVQFAFRKQEEIGDEIAVAVAIVPKAVLLRHEENLEALGLAVHRFRVANSELTISPVTKRWTTQERRQLALGAAACAVWLAAIFLAPTMREAEFERLTSQVAAIRPAGEKAAVLKAEVERARISATLANEILSVQPPLIVIDGLTQFVPDDTQILELSTDGGRVELEAVAANAMSSAASLTKAKQFRMVRLLTPVSHLGANLERFKLEGALGTTQQIAGETQ